MTTKNRIGLKIPDQSPPMGKVFYLVDKEIKEWIESLPLANIGETSRQIFQTLGEQNRTSIPYKKRFMSAEKFRDPINYVGASLKKHYVDIGFPLTEKAHKIAVLNRELHGRLATAYKCVVVDIVLANNGKSDYNLLTNAIHRVIHHFSRVILLSVLTYDRLPKRLWLELHVLHRLACRYNLESITVKDQLEAHGRSSSIDEAYRRTILFHLASPYKIRQRENIQIFDALLEWSSYARCYNINEAPPESTIFIRQDADLPPSHGSLSIDADPRHLLIVDAFQLIGKIREQFSEQPTTDTLWGIESLNTNLLRQLIQLWSNEQKRAFVRTKLNFELRIAVGLSNIYKLVEAVPDKKDVDTGDTDITGIDKNFAVGNVLEISSNFTLEPLGTQNDINTKRGNFVEFGPNSRDLAEPEPITSIWDNAEEQDGCGDTFLFYTLNESAGGYCLDWKGNNIPKILVGELIGVQSAMVNHQFGIGLVRWMKSNPNESMQVGLQMIAPNVIAVTAQHDNQNNSTSYKCLLLPEIGTSGQPTSFICPSFPFNVGDLLTFNDAQTSRKVKLIRLLESSGAIAQFQFIYLEHPGLPESDGNDDDESGDESDFANLWSTL